MTIQELEKSAQNQEERELIARMKANACTPSQIALALVTARSNSEAETNAHVDSIVAEMKRIQQNRIL